MEILSFILGLLAIAGVVYNYFSRRKLRTNVTEDLKTVRATAVEGLDYMDTAIKQLGNDTNSTKAFSVGLAHRITTDNTNYINKILSDNSYKGKTEFSPFLKALETFLTNNFISIRDAVVTASGFKVDIPAGRVSVSFSSKKASLYGSAKNLELDDIKAMLPKGESSTKKK